jgi:hypothetical protein
VTESPESRRASRAAQARWRRAEEKQAREQEAAAARPVPDPDQRRWRALAGAHWLDPRLTGLAEPPLDPDAAALAAKVRARAAAIEAERLPVAAAIRRLEAALRRYGCLDDARAYLARRGSR